MGAIVSRRLRAPVLWASRRGVIASCFIVAVAFLLVAPSLAAAMSYYAPWTQGRTFTCTQGNNQGPSHNDTANRYAWDFAGLPFGEPVRAAAAGTVIGLRRTAADADPNSNINTPVNYVLLAHADGTRTGYYHLKYNSLPADIQLNATVHQGQVIGGAGSSGWTIPVGAVHLHFTRYNSSGASIPLTFADIGVPVTNGRYTSGNVEMSSPPPPPYLTGDFNKDGVSDFVYSSSGQWAVRSGVAPNGYIAQGVRLGSPGNTFLTGDFNGDRVSDFVISAGGQWAVRSGVAPYGYIAQGVRLGKAGDSFLTGRFNKDSVKDFVVCSSGQWAVRSGAAPYGYIAQGVRLGKAGNAFLTGDFNGDRISDFAISAGGQWAVRSGVAPYRYIAQGVRLGKAGDTFLTGDFNKDGVSDFVISSGGQWAVRSGVAPYRYIAQGVILGR
jgi:murein DD-endopeptidase MepM/ murein hydrolase activator NlpD